MTEGLSKAQHVVYILVFTDIYTFAHTLMCIICAYQIKCRLKSHFYCL